MVLLQTTTHPFTTKQMLLRRVISYIYVLATRVENMSSTKLYFFKSQLTECRVLRCVDCLCSKPDSDSLVFLPSVPVTFYYVTDIPSSA